MPVVVSSSSAFELHPRLVSSSFFTPQSDILNPLDIFPNKLCVLSHNNQQWPNQSLERLFTSALPPLVVWVITCTTLVEIQRLRRSRSRLICLVLLQRSSRRSQDAVRKLRRRVRSGQVRPAQSLTMQSRRAKQS